jgi:hypothetical protein
MIRLYIHHKFASWIEPYGFRRYDAIHAAIRDKKVEKHHFLENREIDMIGIFFVYFMFKEPTRPTHGLFAITEPHVVIHILRFVLPKIKVKDVHNKKIPLTIERLLKLKPKPKPNPKKRRKKAVRQN